MGIFICLYRLLFSQWKDSFSLSETSKKLLEQQQTHLTRHLLLSLAKFDIPSRALATLFSNFPSFTSALFSLQSPDGLVWDYGLLFKPRTPVSLFLLWSPSEASTCARSALYIEGDYSCDEVQLFSYQLLQYLRIESVDIPYR